MKYYTIVKKENYFDCVVTIMMTAKICEKTKTFDINDGFINVPKGSKIISEEKFLNLIRGYKPMVDEVKNVSEKPIKIDLRNDNEIEL